MKILTTILLIFCLHNIVVSQKENSELTDQVLAVKLIDNNNDTITFKSLLLQNSGKFVYIDFWASWCATCISELKYSNLLDDHFADSTIVFLYLSSDTEQQSWQKIVIKQSSPQKHYRILTEDKYLMQNFFNIKSIPHSVVLDRNHNLLIKKTKYASHSKAENEILEIINKE